MFGWLKKRHENLLPIVQMSGEDVVRYYQGLGLLRSKAPDSLLTEYEEQWSKALDPNKPWDDVYLLSLDRERVWTDDPECDVCAYNRVYSEVIPEWSRLAKDEFNPRDIEERWESETGPITVSFTLNGVRCGIRPEYLDDYLDLSILTQINGLISATGVQFVCASDVNFAIVFAVREETRRKLLKERRFPFLF